MKLFKGDAIKRVNNLLDKGEKRRAKLEEKVAKLQEEQNAMQQAVMDDFNESILEDKEPNKRLTNDLNKVREELQSAQFQLSQIDVVIEVELEKSKADIERERREFAQSKRDEFREIYDELNQAKIAYLEKLVEYRKKHSTYVGEHWGTFREISHRLKLGTVDPREQFKLSIGMRYQRHDAYSPILTPDEHRDAFLEGRVPKKKDAFKK